MFARHIFHLKYSGKKEDVESGGKKGTKLVSVICTCVGTSVYPIRKREKCRVSRTKNVNSRCRTRAKDVCERCDLARRMGRLRAFTSRRSIGTCEQQPGR